MLLERGKVIFRRAYCDWSRFREAKTGLHELAVELIDVPPSTRAGKNGADMRLVIDALELNYARQHIDTFVIASGDSDFVPLANKLRENDKRVIGLAVKEATSPFFVRACDEFLYLPTSRGGRPRERAAPRRASAPSSGQAPRPPRPDHPAAGPRGGVGAARARHRPAQPVAHQGDDGAQGAGLRRERPRLLHLLAAAAGHGEGGPAETAANRRAPVVRGGARRRGPAEPAAGRTRTDVPAAPERPKRHPLESRGGSVTWFGRVAAPGKLRRSSSSRPAALLARRPAGWACSWLAARTRAGPGAPSRDRPRRRPPRPRRAPSFDPRTALLEASVASLTSASVRGDRAELARWADRLGPARVATLLQRRERATVLAALDGTRTLEGNVRLLPWVTRLIGDGDAAGGRAGHPDRG